MKITAIESLVCHAHTRNWVIVKVITDQDGLWGWGEATLPYHTRAIVGAIKDLSHLLIGQDPRRVEHLWQMMYRQHSWHGNGLVRATATSGIDIALWDIMGKVHGVPCHQLWGGPVRDYMRTYCMLDSGQSEEFRSSPPDDAKRFVHMAQRAVRDGFTAIKALAVPSTMPLAGLAPLRRAAMIIEAMRTAVGEAIDIMVDCHARPSPRMGLQFAKVLEPFGLFWLEEPCWPEIPDALADIQRAVATPIAAGERLSGTSAFRDLLERRACSVLQPDIAHCGGLSEARRIAAMAEAYRVAMAPHNSQGPISTAAMIEFGFATPSLVIAEAGQLEVPWRQDVVQEGFTTEPKGRLVRPNARPGLGVEINEAEVRKHPFEQEELEHAFYDDGSVGDW